MAKQLKSAATPETDEPDVKQEVVETFSTEEETKALAIIKQTDLAHLKELDVKIKMYKDKYFPLKIVDENDKDGYENVRLALGDMRPTRTALNNERKETIAPYTTTAKYISSKYNEKINEIASLEAPLKFRKKEIDDIAENIKQEEARQKEIELNQRVDSLIKSGFTFDGAYYSFEAKPELCISGGPSIGVVDLRVMTEPLFKDFLQIALDKSEQVKNKEAELHRQKDEEERAEKQRKKQQEEKDEEDRLRRAKEDEDFKKRQEDFENKQKDWQEHQDKIAEDNRKKQEEFDKKEKERLQAIFIRRDAHLQELGFSRTGNDYWAFGENYFTTDDVSMEEEEQFTILVDKYLPELQEKKKVITEKAEQYRKDEEKRIADKAIADKQEADRLQKIQEEEELTKASDKKKYDALVQNLRAVAIPEMKNSTYKNRVLKITEFLNSL